MLSRPLIAAGVALVVAASFGAVTLFALEGQGVAVLHTIRPQGGQRSTRVWFAESGGNVWIEAATTERPFYSDIASHSVVALELRQSFLDSNPRIVRGRAERVPGPEGRQRIREMFAEKYGWADTWIGLLQDTSASRAVRVALSQPAEPLSVPPEH